MSGGSYNYLFTKESLFELMENITDLEDMNKRLKQLKNNELVSKATQELLDEVGKLKQFIDDYEKKNQPKILELSEVWKAVEFCDSGDYSQEKVQQAIKEYSQKIIPHTNSLNEEK